MTNKILNITLGLLLVFSQQGIAQKPEQIYSHAQVRKSNEFYIEQIALWKKETEKDKTNANAWYNYYKANRYAHASGGHDSVYASNRFQKIEGIVKEIETNIPNTFEAHFIKWANGYNNWDLLPELEKAYAINPDRWETYDGFINLYEMQRNMEKRDVFVKKLFDSEKRSPGLLNYNYNVLMSLKPNAILITAGDNDTYFAWMLQVAMGVRKDILIVNVGLGSMKPYADNLSKELGVNLPNTEVTNYDQYASKLFKELVKNKAKRPVYAALTVGEEFIKPVEQNLYLIGLAYEYSTEPIDNIALLKKNFEKVYELDYLNHSFAKDPYETIVDVANSNYTVPMLTLYNHYKLSGDKERAMFWREKVELVARNSGNEKELADYFKD